MLRVFAITMGIIFIIFGILGFAPEFVKDNRLFGLFAITSYHNLLHIGIGILGILSAFNGPKSARYYFIALGVAYGVVALVGVYNNSIALLRFIALNGADTWLQAVIAGLSLYFAFSYQRKKPQD